MSISVSDVILLYFLSFVLTVRTIAFIASTAWLL